MKYLLILIVALGITGCGPYDRTSVRVECDDGDIYLTVWRDDFVGKGEDIKYDHNLILRKTKQNIKCKDNE